MNGRRVAIGASLLCALVFCAFAAPSAMAVEGTTIAECENAGKDFRGEHCLTTGTAALAFSHKAIGEGVKTKFEGTNQKTASETTAITLAVLKGELSGGTLEIAGQIFVSVGTLTNEEPKAMRAKGTGTMSFGLLEPIEKGNCKVVGGKIFFNVNIETKTNAAGEMWVEYKGANKEEGWTEFELEGGKCPFLKDNPIRLKGAAIGTPNGATLEFKAKEPKNALEFNGNKKQAEYIVPETLRIEKGNPIVFTTMNP